MTEKEAIIAHYERMREQQKADGTYDPSRAEYGGMGGYSSQINESNCITPKKLKASDEARVLKSWWPFYYGENALQEEMEKI